LFPLQTEYRFDANYFSDDEATIPRPRNISEYVTGTSSITEREKQMVSEVNDELLLDSLIILLNHFMLITLFRLSSLSWWSINLFHKTNNKTNLSCFFASWCLSWMMLSVLCWLD
jgi:hypothetical protein